MRCRRQQETRGHRGRKGDPLWTVRRDLLRAREHLTTTAWTLKEVLRDVYASADRHAAEASLADWHTSARAHDVAETNRLARALRSWEPELLADFDGRLTDGPIEGTNRIIKAVKRQGFGYTNAENYRWRVLHRCA